MLYSSTRQLDITMKLSWILSVTGVCANIYGSDTQQVLGGSVDLFGNAYTCENGMFLSTISFICRSLLYQLGVKPSIDCTDPSSESPNCSCTCTNGITFNQTLSSTFPTDTISGPSIDECQADKTQCLTQNDELKAQLDKQKEENLLREQNLQAELKKREPPTYRYLGCYTDPDRNVFTTLTATQSLMTIDMCAKICSEYSYYGLINKTCYCDSQFRVISQKVAQSRCESRCPGELSKMCGGAYTLGVWAKN